MYRYRIYFYESQAPSSGLVNLRTSSFELVCCPQTWSPGYDWRVGPSYWKAKGAYFDQLQARIQKLYQDNDGRKVVMVSFSLGSPVASLFLNSACSAASARYAFPRCSLAVRPLMHHLRPQLCRSVALRAISVMRSAWHAVITVPCLFDTWQATWTWRGRKSTSSTG